MYVVHLNSITIALVTILTLAAVGSTFGDEYCKWTDENGVVHYDENCPDDVTSAVVATEGKRTESQIKAAEETAKSLEWTPNETAEAIRESIKSESEDNAEINANSSPQGNKDFSQMSVEQLEVLCQEEREKRLAPERESLIQDCITDQQKSPEDCKRFYSDYGNAQKIYPNKIVEPGRWYIKPALYSDLPECVAAEEARRR